MSASSGIRSASIYMRRCVMEFLRNSQRQHKHKEEKLARNFLLSSCTRALVGSKSVGKNSVTAIRRDYVMVAAWKIKKYIFVGVFIHIQSTLQFIKLLLWELFASCVVQSKSSKYLFFCIRHKTFPTKPPPVS